MKAETTEPLISLIIPIYNTEKYLEECLFSISEQSYRNIEIILINDGSTDRSLDIASNFAKKDNRAILISQENSGVASARNNGIAHATGDYIIHADSDDVLPNNAIALLCESAILENSDIVLGDYIIEKKKKLKRINLNFNGDQNSLLTEILTGEQQGSLWNKLIRRSLYNLVIFEPGINFTEDKLFLARLLARANNIKISYINQPVYIYRHRSGSYTTTFSNKSLADISSTTDILCFELKHLYSSVFLEHLKRQIQVLKIINTNKAPNDRAILDEIYSDRMISLPRRILVWLTAHRLPSPLFIYKKAKAAINYIT